MQTIDIRDAGSNLDQLIERAAKGDGFIIAKAGKPLVKVTAFDASLTFRPERLGFMMGMIEVPADFDSMGDDAIERAFGGL